MKRVLVIDDDAELRRLLRLVLEEHGFTVTEAGDGKAGLQLVSESQPNLVLCDVFMPRKDGLSTIREVRRTFPSVKIIAMSGGAFGGKVDLLRLAKGNGASVCLHKPFDPQALLLAVQNLLGLEPSVP
jgi:CheY-like chemotaxis protein